MADVRPKTNLSVDQIVADWGAYYKNGGQGEENLHMLPFESFDTQDAFTTVPTENTVLDEVNVEVEDMLQQYQDDFTPKGGIGFEPVRIPLYQVKIDQKFNPKKLERSYLGFLTSTKIDVTQWPFIRWFVDVYLMKAAKDELEKKAIYKAVYEAPEEGVPGEASKIMNGMEKIMNDLIDAGKVAPIEIGAIEANDDDFVTQVELFAQRIPEQYRSMSMDINMSRDLRDKFKRGTRLKYKANYDPSDIKNYRVADAESLTVMGRPSMSGKSRIWATPKFNALFGVKGFENMDAFQVEGQERFVSIYTDWWLGLGIVQPKLLFSTNGDR